MVNFHTVQQPKSGMACIGYDLQMSLPPQHRQGQAWAASVSNATDEPTLEYGFPTVAPESSCDPWTNFGCAMVLTMHNGAGNYQHTTSPYQPEAQATSQDIADNTASYGATLKSKATSLLNMQCSSGSAELRLSVKGQTKPYGFRAHLLQY